MKHLTIRHFGPLQEADVLLDRVNLIIGLQGSGKSCVMMLACYCTWVEKRIVIGHKSDYMEFQYDHSYPVKGGLYKIKTASDEDIQGICQLFLTFQLQTCRFLKIKA